MAILITGGLGFIGSHMTAFLLEKDFECVVIDNLSNAHISTINQINQCVPNKNNLFHFHNIDITDYEGVEYVLKKYNIIACIHFAGLKAVGESVQYPLLYYANNVTGSLVLLNLLKKYNCKNVIFSSSSTVYGDAKRDNANIVETDHLQPVNPYGKTKLYVENMFIDVSESEKDQWNVDILRYFNPVGSHPSGLLSENPVGEPKNLFPYISQVIEGKQKKLRIFGDTYLTRDGTGERDYIHVMDLVDAHYASLKDILRRVEEKEPGTYRVYNVGTGKGTTVLEVLHLFEKIIKKPIPMSICSIRPGDITRSVCNVDKIKTELKWEPKYSLEDAVNHLLRSKIYK
jgi:UDP-glucose-4-epimerase GalE